MKKSRHATWSDASSLAEEARTLMAVTADVAGERIGEARERLAAALESVKEMAGNVRDKAVAGANATDEAVRENPYITLAAGVVAGTIIGFLAGRQTSGRSD